MTKDVTRNRTFAPGTPSKKGGFGSVEYINIYPLFLEIRIVFSFPLALKGLKLLVFVARMTNRFPLE